jgi:hypothetical protein
MMDIIVQWATILSPIIAVLIAVWVILSSKKDTDKQIESIKELSSQQIDASIKQVELEIEKNLLLARQAKQEWEGIKDINNSGLSGIVEWKDGAMRSFKENKPERDYKLYCKFIKDLEGIKQGLVSNKNKMC